MNKATMKTMMQTIHFGVALFFVLFFHQSRAQIRLVDNGYENLNIIIKDTVKEDSSLIDRIQDVFTNASKLLFKATKNRAYFKNITIVIPKKWSKTESNQQLPTISTFGEHVRVDRKNKARQDAPYVRGHLECGRPGWFIHLTPGFLNISGITPYGPHANAIVHEWGHLRWGLFDEYASLQYPGTSNPNSKIHFYNENGQWRPVTCSEQIKGGAYRRNCDSTKPCNLNSITINSKCRFCPDLQQTARASFMASQWIQSLDSFCDVDSDDTDTAIRHNSKAPNAQNNFCNGQSAWEVMRKHVDFIDGANPPAPMDTDTTPTFNIVKEIGRVRVFVYDVSGSMGGSKIIQQKLASYVVIDNVIETGSWLGLVEFNRVATTLEPLTEIRNKASRRALKNAVPTRAGGGTEIYNGLAKGIQVIENSIFSTQGTEIVLLSDGQSNSPYLHIVPELQDKGIIVHTISITQAADANMATLAEQTGGRSFTYLETNSVSFADVLSQAVSGGSVDSDATEKVFSKVVTVSSTTPLEDSFTIDEGLGNSTIITVTQLDSATYIYPITVNVSGPGGYNFTNTSSLDIVYFEMDDFAYVGMYFINITTSSSNDIELEVTVTTLPVSDDVEVIRVTSFFSNTIVDFTSKEQIKLYASVEKAGSPVLNVNVTAVLAGDAGFQTKAVIMKDHGTGADLVANDGVYTGYLLKTFFAGNKRYNVKVTVTGDDGAFTYTTDAMSDYSTSIPGAVEEIEYKQVNVSNFQRQSLPGEITVVNYVSNAVDTTPPARISDLRVEAIVEDKAAGVLTYTFVWTAVGEDMDVGTATSYDMRMDPNVRNVRNNFDNTTTVPVNLTQPKQAGMTERYDVNFTLNDCNGTCYVGIRATDTSGLTGDLSNLVNIDIDFSYEAEEIFPDDDDDVTEATPETTSTTQEGTVTQGGVAIDSTGGTTEATTSASQESRTTRGEGDVDSYTEDVSSGLVTPQVIGIAAGSAVFVVILISILILVCKYNRRNKNLAKQKALRERGGEFKGVDKLPAVVVGNPCYDN